jgi:teichuronic acid biosynthesis glycosyltransferase TuaG
MIQQRHNARPGAARQVAITRSQSRFLASLDSDDLWLPAKLEQQIAFARERRTAMIFAAFRRINENRYINGSTRISHL